MGQWFETIVCGAKGDVVFRLKVVLNVFTLFVKHTIKWKNWSLRAKELLQASLSRNLCTRIIGISLYLLLPCVHSRKDENTGASRKMCSILDMIYLHIKSSVYQVRWGCAKLDKGIATPQKAWSRARNWRFRGNTVHKRRRSPIQPDAIVTFLCGSQGTSRCQDTRVKIWNAQVS